MPFVKATKQQAKGRIALIGVSGSGKSYTSLMWARAIAGPNGRIAVIDTEAGSASKYADEFQFDTLILESFSPRSYIAAIHEAEAGEYDVTIVDSLSHAWAGKDGVLAMVDNATARSKSGNAFTTGWREATPEHNNLVDALVRCSTHLIVTMRAKTEYVIEESNGRKMPKKVGMAPVQRDGLEYEFDLVGDMDTEHTLVVTKSRCRALADQVIRKPDEKPAEILRKWLTDGAIAPQKPKATAQQIRDISGLLDVVRLPEGTTQKWLAKAGVSEWKDMPPDAMANCIKYLKARLPEAEDPQPENNSAVDDEPKKEDRGQKKIDYLKWYDHMESVAATVGCPPEVFNKGLAKCLERAKVAGPDTTDQQRKEWEKALLDGAGFFAVPKETVKA